MGGMDDFSASSSSHFQKLRDYKRKKRPAQNMSMDNTSYLLNPGLSAWNNDQ